MTKKNPGLGVLDGLQAFFSILVTNPGQKKNPRRAKFDFGRTHVDPNIIVASKDQIKRIHFWGVFEEEIVITWNDGHLDSTIGQGPQEILVQPKPRVDVEILASVGQITKMNDLFDVLLFK